MKKKTLFLTVSIAILIFTVGAGAFFFYLPKSLKPSHSFSAESILPRGAIFYMHFSEVKKTVEHMSKSKFLESMLGLDYDTLIEKGILKRENAQLIKVVEKNLSNFLSSILFEKLFSQEVFLAIYPNNMGFDSVPQMKNDSPSAEEVIKSVGIFFVTRVPLEVRLADSLLSLFDSSFKNISRRGLEYKNRTISIIKFKDIDLRISYVRIKDLLVFGLGDKAAQLSVDVHEGLSSSLVEDEELQLVKNKAMTPSHIKGVLNIDVIFSRFKLQMLDSMDIFSLSEEEKKKAITQIQNSFNDVMGFKFMGFSFEMNPKKISKAAVQFFYRTKELNSSMKNFYTCPSSYNKTLPFIPKDAIAYQWSNCINFKDISSQMKEKMNQKQDAENKKRNNSQVQILDVLEKNVSLLLSDEIGGYLTDVEKGAIGPLPKLLLFAKVANKRDVEILLEGFKDSPMFFLREEQYGDISLKYVVFPMDISLEPSFCFLDDYLLLAVNRQLLRDSIDSYSNKSGLSDAFQSVSYPLKGKNRGVQFFDVERISESLNKIVLWTKESVIQSKKRKDKLLGTKKKELDLIRGDILERKNEIKSTQEKIALIDEEIKELKSEKMNAAQQKKLRATLGKKVKAFKDEVVVQLKNIEDAAVFIKRKENEKFKLESQQVFLEEVFPGIIRGLNSWQAMGTKTKIGSGIFEFLMYISPKQ